MMHRADANGFALDICGAVGQASLAHGAVGLTWIAFGARCASVTLLQLIESLSAVKDIETQCVTFQNLMLRSDNCRTLRIPK